MIAWAGRILVFYGAAHLIGALTVEEAGSHAGAWFRGDIRDDDLANMSAAGSAYWLSLASFSVPLILLGLTVLWLDRQGMTPPVFIPWTLGALTLVDAFVETFTPWPLLLGANVMLLVGARRRSRDGSPSSLPASGRTGPMSPAGRRGHV